MSLLITYYKITDTFSLSFSLRILHFYISLFSNYNNTINLIICVYFLQLIKVNRKINLIILFIRQCP